MSLSKEKHLTLGSQSPALLVLKQCRKLILHQYCQSSLDYFNYFRNIYHLPSRHRKVINGSVSALNELSKIYIIRIVMLIVVCRCFIITLSDFLSCEALKSFLLKRYSLVRISCASCPRNKTQNWKVCF